MRPLGLEIGRCQYIGTPAPILGAPRIRWRPQELKRICPRKRWISHYRDRPPTRAQPEPSGHRLRSSAPPRFLSESGVWHPAISQAPQGSRNLMANLVCLGVSSTSPPSSVGFCPSDPEKACGQYRAGPMRLQPACDGPSRADRADRRLERCRCQERTDAGLR